MQPENQLTLCFDGEQVVTSNLLTNRRTGWKICTAAWEGRGVLPKAVAKVKMLVLDTLHKWTEVGF
jgi:hypothetical protein